MKRIVEEIPNLKKEIKKMPNNIHKELTDYYMEQDIHPLNFKCKHKCFCQRFAHNGVMTEAKMSMVGSLYVRQFPRIVVVSLDPPRGKGGDFEFPKQRTVQYVTQKHKVTNYRNPHWAMTQIIVRELLCMFHSLNDDDKNAAVVEKSYAGLPIVNVADYFAHVNVAKCSMNDPKSREADEKVHKICGNSYLKKEIEKLQPDILITQGKSANRIVGLLFSDPLPSDTGDMPFSKMIDLDQNSVLWLIMDHPAFGGVKSIRRKWKSYIHSVKEWARKRYIDKEKPAGSRLRCLMLTSQNSEAVAECLNSPIGGYGSVIIDGRDSLRPNGFLSPDEAVLGRGTRFLSARQNDELIKWWLKQVCRNPNLPNWDIVCNANIEGRDGLLLIEAKAHEDELCEKDKCKAKAGGPNHGQIRRAIQDASENLRRCCPQTWSGWNLSCDSHYQVSNRFAWCWKLASLGIPIILVYLGFLNADEMKDPPRKGIPFTSHEHWRMMLLEYAKGIVPEEAWEHRIEVQGTPIYPLIRSMDLRWNAEGVVTV